MAAAVKIIDGLKILLKYYPDAEVDAQHDKLLAGGPKPEKLEETDRAELANLGWTYDIGEESWRRFT
jgi:hypothetical protein